MIPGPTSLTNAAPGWFVVDAHGELVPVEMWCVKAVDMREDSRSGMEKIPKEDLDLMIVPVTMQMGPMPEEGEVIHSSSPEFEKTIATTVVHFKAGDSSWMTQDLADKYNKMKKEAE